MHTESLIEQVRHVAKRPNAPQSMIKTGDDVLPPGRVWKSVVCVNLSLMLTWIHLQLHALYIGSPVIINTITKAEILPTDR